LASNFFDINSYCETTYVSLALIGVEADEKPCLAIPALLREVESTIMSRDIIGSRTAKPFASRVYQLYSGLLQASFGA
jgi:hypothetical protein